MTFYCLSTTYTYSVTKWLMNYSVKSSTYPFNNGKPPAPCTMSLRCNYYSFMHRVWSHGSLYICRSPFLYFLRLIGNTAVHCNTEGRGRANKSAVRKPVYPDQLEKPAKTREKNQGKGPDSFSRICLSPPPTWRTALLFGGLDLLRRSLLLLYR